MNFLTAQTILAALSILFAVLAITRWLKDKRQITPAVKAWGRIAIIFGVVSLLLNLV